MVSTQNFQHVTFIFCAGAIGFPVSYNSSNASEHHIIDLNCTGYEADVLDCPYNGLTNYNCSLSRDANVFCQCK